MVKESSELTDFNIEQIFGSQTRTRLLQLFLANPQEIYFVREIARKIDAQLNSVRRELDNLINFGIVRETINPDDKDKKKFYGANQESIFFADLRSIVKKVQLMMKQNLVHQIDLKGKIELLVLTGQFVDNTSIPVDMLVIGEMEEETLQKVLVEFEKEIGHEVNYTVMPKEEYVYRKQVSDRFLYSILNAEHVTMIDRFASKSPKT